MPRSLNPFIALDNILDIIKKTDVNTTNCFTIKFTFMLLKKFIINNNIIITYPNPEVTTK